MFGLQIIKKQDYLNLKRELADSEALLAEKYGYIRSLEIEIKALNDKIELLSKSIDNKPKKEKKVELISDVSEKPLEVESEPIKKKKVSKKKSE